MIEIELAFEKGEQGMAQTKSITSEGQKSVKKAEKILEGAMQEFLAHGYSATSMDRIAAAGGVAKATIYSHFQDKEKLFTALIERLVREKYRTIFALQHSQSLQGEPRIVLGRLAREMLDNAMEDRQFHDFMRIILAESGQFPHLAQAYVHNLAKPFMEILSQYLESHFELKLRDPEATVRVFMGTLVYFVILQELLYGKDILPMERDRLIDTLIYFIVPEGF